MYGSVIIEVKLQLMKAVLPHNRTSVPCRLLPTPMVRHLQWFLGECISFSEAKGESSVQSLSMQDSPLSGVQFRQVSLVKLKQEICVDIRIHRYKWILRHTGSPLLQYLRHHRLIQSSEDSMMLTVPTAIRPPRRRHSWIG